MQHRKLKLEGGLRSKRAGPSLSYHHSKAVPDHRTLLRAREWFFSPKEAEPPIPPVPTSRAALTTRWAPHPGSPICDMGNGSEVWNWSLVGKRENAGAGFASERVGCAREAGCIDIRPRKLAFIPDARREHWKREHAFSWDGLSG